MMAEDFAAHAAKVSVKFEKAMSPQEIQTLVSGLMTKIALDCLAAGTRLIGHIKCIAEIGPDKYLACSVTNHDGKARCSGGIPHASESLDVVINALQYGLSAQQVGEIVRKNAATAFGKAQVTFQEIGKDESCSRPIQIN